MLFHDVLNLVILILFPEDSKEKARLIKVSVTIPHNDGLFPAISTHPLGDAFHILKSYSPRAEIHKCSNIITNKEVPFIFFIKFIECVFY